MAVVMIIATRYSTRLVAAYGQAAVAGGGLLLVATGVFWLSAWGTQASYLQFLGGLIVAGIGNGLAMPPLSHALITSLPSEHSGVGAALNSTMRELGSSFGIALVGTATSAVFLSRHFPASTLGATLATTRDPIVAEAAKQAFSAGSGLGLQLGAGLVTVVALAVFRWLPRSVSSL
jgi:hypothetical protein